MQINKKEKKRQSFCQQGLVIAFKTSITRSHDSSMTNLINKPHSTFVTFEQNFCSSDKKMADFTYNELNVACHILTTKIGVVNVSMNATMVVQISCIGFDNIARGKLPLRTMSVNKVGNENRLHTWLRACVINCLSNGQYRSILSSVKPIAEN